jgi:NAD(P)-dependent dehydrogenase (short-subunit alcohol dehydrogenase family)
MSNPYDYTGKNLVITGAFSGVGAALLDVVSEMGASSVTVLDLRKPEGPHSQFIETNMGDAAAVASAAGQIGDVDVLFNNAGIAATFPAMDVMAVNYLGLRQLTEALLPKVSAGGSIVNTASIAGGQWPANLASILELLALEDRDASVKWMEEHADLIGDGYAFSKECVQVYTMKSAKASLAQKVRTNSVCPAPIDTPLMEDFKKTMTEKTINWTVDQCGGTIATARDIALALSFFGSDASGYVNGVNLNVDGGFSGFMTTGQLDFSGLA